MHKTLLPALAAASLLVSTAGTAADALNVAGLAGTCNNCHGVDGQSVGLSMPSLAGQPAPYLKMVMDEWKSGERFSTTMGRLLKGYSDEEIAALANYYAAKPWTPAVQDLNAKLVKNGGFAMERCSKCHGDTGSEPDDDDNETPFLHGQWARFLELEMLKYRDPAVKLSHEKMRRAATKLEAEEVPAVSAFLAAQKQ